LTASVDISREGRSVISLVSPYKIVADPVVQDLSYTASEGSAGGN
jgi:hypothetical protein